MLAALAGLGLFAVGSRRVGVNEACKIKTASGDEIDFNVIPRPQPPPRLRQFSGIDRNKFK